MEIIKIPKSEYKKLQHYKTAYFSILETIARTEPEYEYDIEYIEKLKNRVLKEYKSGKCIEAKSIDEALSKYSKR
jgi:hypothetical protein